MAWPAAASSTTNVLKETTTPMMRLAEAVLLTPEQHHTSNGGTIRLASTTEVQLRFLCPDDLNEVRVLCQDWFPIDYPLSWYQDITSSTRFFALAAVLHLQIIGLIVAEIKPYKSANREDRGFLPECLGRDCDVAYILSLGVHKKHRRNGIGSLLLDALITHLTLPERFKVKAIFLHVLTTNQHAIFFYENRRFILHSFLPYYYSIRGKCKDGYTYVSYLNGGHPPWSFYDNLKHWCSLVWQVGGLFSWFRSRARNVCRWFLFNTVSRLKFSSQQ